MSFYEKGSKSNDSTSPKSWKEWVWPAPIWEGRKPFISDTFQREATSEHRSHLGVDVVYKRLPEEPAKLPRGSKGAYIPIGAPALAAYKGTIWSAAKGSRGHSVIVDHGNVSGIGPLVTFYQHLSSFSKDWKKGDVVTTGQELGEIGGDLPPNYTLMHLHFELWMPRKGVSRENWAVDPKDIMTRYWGFVKKPNGQILSTAGDDGDDKKPVRDYKSPIVAGLVVGGVFLAIKMLGDKYTPKGVV